MTEQPVGPRCGNNPHARLTSGDRKVLDDFRARLALEAAAKPYIEAAAWVDGDPLMEVIAVTLWRHCARDDKDMPQQVCDDPRTIAAFAAAVARTQADDAPAVPSVSAVDQTTRDRIAEAPAVWIDGHPQLEAIAAAVWEHCRTEDTSLVVDDPRNIAVAALAAVLPPNADQAAELVKQIGLRDYWHQEAMSATARIIELETKRRRLADEAQQPAVGARQPDTETLPPPEGPEYTPCACGHIEPEHEADMGPCLTCDCEAYTIQTGEDSTQASPLLFWDEAAGVVHHDGQITFQVNRAINVAQFAPAGRLVLQVQTAGALRRQLTSALTDAYAAASAVPGRSAATSTDEETQA